jgi:glycogen operon protein
VEGDTNDPQIIERRRYLQRALLATLFAAQGVPMLQGGDELGRTQRGNNNAYCQDNALTWLDWTNADPSLIEYTAGLIALRRRFGQLRRVEWFTGDEDADGKRDVLWWHPNGHEMKEQDWHASSEGALGMLLEQTASDDGPDHPPNKSNDSNGSNDSALLILFNRNAASVVFHLPPGFWRQLCCSNDEAPFKVRTHDSVCLLAGHSVLLLIQEDPKQ